MAARPGPNCRFRIAPWPSRARPPSPRAARRSGSFPGAGWLSARGARGRGSGSRRTTARIGRRGHAPLRQGIDSAGLFSLAGTDGADAAHAADTEWIAVGGDYRADRERREVAYVTRDRGLSWRAIVPPPAGFRSAVEPLPAALGGGWVATGTSGTDIAANTAAGFEALSVEGFHAVRAAKRGHLVVLAGAGGRLARLVPPQ